MGLVSLDCGAGAHPLRALAGPLLIRAVAPTRRLKPSTAPLLVLAVAQTWTTLQWAVTVRVAPRTEAWWATGLVMRPLGVGTILGMQAAVWTGALLMTEASP